MGTRKYPVELRERAVRLYRESDPKPVIRRLAEQLNPPRGVAQLDPPGRGHCQVEQSEGDFRRFASAIHQVACDV